MNTADSPFAVQDNQSTGGKNFEYTLTGGFRKIKGATKINSSADTALKTLGIGLHITSSGTKTVIRAADRKIQAVDLSTPSFTNLSEDTVAAGTNFLASNSTVPVAKTQFNTTSANVLWMVGGGMTSLYGAYSSTKATANGVAEPGGSISLSTSADASAPDFSATGYYRYAIAFRKASTQAIGNAALFKEVHLTTVTDKVTIDLSSVTGIDTTKYDKIYIYRSAVSASAQGDVAFTTGDFVGSTNSSSSSYDDTGGYTSTSQNVPQVGNTLLDNSPLPSGTPAGITTFKRHLVTAINSTLYISDTNKPESWPLHNYITIPSGGPITGLAVISFTTPTSTSIDEILAVFKDNELWVVTGTGALTSGIPDWSLKLIDTVGCPNQTLVVSANGYLSWIEYRGVWMWDGSAKPIYCSRPIGDLFKEDGAIDKTKLNRGWGAFFRNRDQIIWCISTNTQGEQLFQLKMDTRLTLPQIQTNLGGRIIDGVFMNDVLNRAYYAGDTQMPSSEEILLSGDGSGYLYTQYTAFDDAGSAIAFNYATRFLDLGTPGMGKRYSKVIAWCSDDSAANLTLDFWTQYTASTDFRATQVQQTPGSGSSAYWDIGYWDTSYWDGAIQGYNPVVFNLSSQEFTPNEGDCIRLQFRQEDANAPITIAGFSVVYAEASLRK